MCRACSSALIHSHRLSSLLSINRLSLCHNWHTHTFLEFDIKVFCVASPLSAQLITHTRQFHIPDMAHLTINSVINASVDLNVEFIPVRADQDLLPSLQWLSPIDTPSRRKVTLWIPFRPVRNPTMDWDEAKSKQLSQHISLLLFYNRKDAALSLPYARPTLCVCTSPELDGTQEFGLVFNPLLTTHLTNLLGKLNLQSDEVKLNVTTENGEPQLEQDPRLSIYTGIFTRPIPSGFSCHCIMYPERKAQLCDIACGTSVHRELHINGNGYMAHALFELD
jgi:hypothetical protein